MSIPIGGILMFHGAIADRPTDFNICDGGTYDDYVTPNLTSRFVYGASADGDVDSRAGAATHTHTNPDAGSSGSHSHTYSGLTATGSGGIEGLESGGSTFASRTHTHAISESGSLSTASAHSHSIADTASGSSLPAYIKAYYIMNTANAAIEYGELPVGAIVAWESGTYPTNWQLADGTNSTLDLRDKFVYGAAIDGDVGDTGGASTHTHTSATTGDAGSHSHTGGGSVTLAESATSVSVNRIGGTRTASVSLHTHTATLSFGSVSNHSHSLSALNSATNVPIYIKLYFIEKTA
jgi:hypothetical protein